MFQPFQYLIIWVFDANYFNKSRNSLTFSRRPVPLQRETKLAYSLSDVFYIIDNKAYIVFTGLAVVGGGSVERRLWMDGKEVAVILFMSGKMDVSLFFCLKKRTAVRRNRLGVFA